MSNVVIPFIDFSDESSTCSPSVADAISDANITVLFNAIAGVTLGNAQKSILVTRVDKDAGTLGKPANKEAQREKKWRVKYIDDVNGRIGSFEIPCADLSFLSSGDDMDVGVGTEGETLTNAVESHVRSRDDNAVTVSSIKFVGRNT